MASSRVLPSSYNTHTFGTAGAGRDYTSIATWESDHTIDLAIAGKGEVLDCYDDAGSFDQSGINVAGATNSSATIFRLIRAPSGQRHDGTPNNGFMIATSTAANVITLTEAYSQLHDLIVISTLNSASSYIAIKPSGTGTKAIGCIVKIINTGSGSGIGFRPDGNSSAIVINCLAYECKTYGFELLAASTFTISAFNCNAINSAIGFYMHQGATAGTIVLTNCLGDNNATADFSSDGLVTETVTYCLSKDATADDWGGAGNLISKTLTFVNAAGDDWHLAAADTDAINAGTDLSGMFDDDIDFQTRGASWDIGFDEFTFIYPAGITSSESFGASSIKLYLVPSGITSLEALGSPSIKRYILPSGVPSAQSFGSPSIKRYVLPTGIASLEASGNPNVNFSIFPTGISSSQALGNSQVNFILHPSGISSNQSFGSANIKRFIIPSGISSAQNFGSAVVTAGNLFILPSGIASGQAFGLASISRFILPSGISSDEAFGTGKLIFKVYPSGISSREIFGNSKLNLVLYPTGISTSQVFGNAIVIGGISYILPSGIASGEAFGLPILLGVTQFISPMGIFSGELFGTLTVTYPKDWNELKATILYILRTDSILQGLLNKSSMPFGVYFARPPARPPFPVLTMRVLDELPDGENNPQQRTIRLEFKAYSATNADDILERVEELLNQATKFTDMAEFKVSNAALTAIGPDDFDADFNIYTSSHQYLFFVDYHSPETWS
jgi:hypothetical protein